MALDRRPLRAVVVAAGCWLALFATEARAMPITGALSRHEREDVAAGLARIPVAGVGAVDPARIARDIAPCPADGLPEDEALWDDRGQLHLCASDGGATLVEHVATAALFASPFVVTWADLRGWRRLNRWNATVASLGRPVADNRAREGFAAPAGMRSPRWDLATFAAAAFLDQSTEDDRVACRLMSQAAFLRERLTDEAIGSPPAPACAAFERWAAEDRLASVEVVLAAPSTAMLGSLFGHVILRVSYRDDTGQTPLHLSRTIAFLANNERPLDDDPGYAVKGILGFYEASLHEREFLETFREYVVDEGRDLQRWRLALDARETHALLERLWTAMNGRARYAYYFFRRNCATLLLDLIDDARPPDAAVSRPGLLAAPPSSTLEAWAAARASSGGPLLDYVPEPILSFQSEARTASLARRAREPPILAAFPPASVPAVAVDFRDAHARAPAIRAAAYARLGPLLASAPPSARADVTAWLRASAAVESHLSAIANQEAAAEANRARRQRLKANVAALAVVLDAAASAPELRAAVAALRSDEPERRLEGYRALEAMNARLPARARLFAVLTSELQYDVARMNGVPGLRDSLVFVAKDDPVEAQPYMAGFEDLVRCPVETRVAPPLRAVVSAEAALGGAPGPDEERAPGALRASVARSYEAERSRSGIDQLAVLGAVMAQVARDAHPAAGLMLTGALYDDELGGHRRFGFASDTGFVVARSRMLVATDGHGVRVPFYDLRLVGYRSLRGPVLEATGRTGLGWELFADTAGDEARAVANETKVGWGLLAPLLARDQLAEHALLAFGLSARARTSSAAGLGRGYAVGAPLALEGRATLGRTDHRSWTSARLWIEPMLAAGSALPREALEGGLTAEAHLALRSRAESGRHDPALVLRLDATRSATATASALVALVSAGLELR